jgi:hypothetical protein
MALLVQHIGPVTSLVAIVIVGICGPNGWSLDHRYTGIVFDIVVQADDTVSSSCSIFLLRLIWGDGGARAADWHYF